MDSQPAAAARYLALPRGRSLELGSNALIMGVINVTPDSFYASSRRASASEAVEAALAMEKAGAAIIDIGGESTRPGAACVDADEEIRRLVPALEALRRVSDVAISVDTRKAKVARAAIDAGADIINDVSGLGHDPAMAALAAESGVPLVLMHMRGKPATMQLDVAYVDCVAEVRCFLLEAARTAMAAGVLRERIILDPGIGFGKGLSDNCALIARLDELAAAGYPVLVGISRKSCIGGICGRDAEERLAGSLGAACAAYAGGARIFRVHDVAETRDALAVFAACRLSGNLGGRA